MKKYILVCVLGFLWPQIASGQTMRFITTIGSPNGVFSRLEVKGVEVKGTTVCNDEGTGSCSATVTNVDALQFLTRSAAAQGAVGMIYLPPSKAEIMMEGDRPADLGIVRFDQNASVTGDVRSFMGTNAAATDPAPFTDVIIPQGSTLSVRRIENQPPTNNVTLRFNQIAGDPNPPAPFLAAGILRGDQSFPPSISALAMDRVLINNQLRFREHQNSIDDSLYDAAQGGGLRSVWVPCSGDANCNCGGVSVGSLEGGCNRYHVLQVQP